MDLTFDSDKLLFASAALKFFNDSTLPPKKSPRDSKSIPEPFSNRKSNVASELCG